MTFLSNTAPAQELTPRAYWPAPKGTHLLVAGYQQSRGDVLTDPSLPIAGVDAHIDFTQITYQHTASLFARTATVQVSAGISGGSAEGFAEGEFRSGRLSAMGDSRLRLVVNLRGAPTMDASGFQALRANPQTIIAASISVQAPTGDYDSNRVINVGTNRWAVKPTLGAIWPLHPSWLLEVELGAWIFEDNEDFLGTTRKQEPILSSALHLVKRLRPGFWASLDVNYYVGGRTTVGTERRADRQRNSRVGGTVVFPFKGRHAIRAQYSTGITTRSGGDFDSFGLSYLYVWLQ